MEGSDPVTNSFELREFTSRSAGWGKKRRAPREVSLVVDLNTGRAVVLKDVPTGRLDTIAQALLGKIENIEDPFAEFVRRLRRRKIS